MDEEGNVKVYAELALHLIGKIADRRRDERMQHRDVHDILDTLKAAKGDNKPATLLIGAGCSETAGIPTAKGLIAEIAKDFPNKMRWVEDPHSYTQCMAALNPDEGRRILKRYIDGAQINWAHIAIALLLKAGYVNRILTTNFDPLLVRACALMGLFPAVYDMATAQGFRPHYIPDQAIFYLHGQHTGFVLLNTSAALTEHATRLKPLFETIGTGCPWLVVGYSGENDPVIDQLSALGAFDSGLYWVGYRDEAPAQPVQEGLLSANKYAYLVQGYDADSFFVDLTQRLDLFPPSFVQEPLVHLKDLIKQVVPLYRPPAQQEGVNVLQAPLDDIEFAIQAIARRRSPADRAIATALENLLRGDYAKVAALYPRLDEYKSPALTELVASALMAEGTKLAKQAINATENHGAEADALYARAGEKYAQALQIKPDKHEALYNWGTALAKQAEMKSGAEADALLAAAGEKYAQALQIKPNYHEALNNWGLTLRKQAAMKSGAEADALFAVAYEKYAQALQFKPNYHEALNNWGVALRKQAAMKSGAEADVLYAAAYEKYAQALQIKPDKHEALNNWGSALLIQSYQHAGTEKESILQTAHEKCLAAEALQPGAGAYNLACISALRGDAPACRHWLETRYRAGTLPAANHIRADRDLAAVRDTGWFQDLLARLEMDANA